MQTAEKALKTPLSGCVTTTLLAVKTIPPPRGTSEAGTSIGSLMVVLASPPLVPELQAVAASPQAAQAVIKKARLGTSVRVSLTDFILTSTFGRRRAA